MESMESICRVPEFGVDNIGIYLKCSAYFR